MNKTDLLNELDILKLKIMMDMNPEPSELDKYERWIDGLLLRDKVDLKEYMYPVSNEKYNKFNLIKTMVLSLLHDKKHNDFDYIKYRREIKRLSTEVIAMTVYYLEEYEKSHLPTNKGKDNG